MNRRTMLAGSFAGAFLPTRRQPRAQGSTDVIPIEIRIDSIRVLATVERISIDGGVMQSPSNLAFAGWYEESAGIAASGNTLMTGYYHWGGLDALFSTLALIEIDEKIVITGGNGRQYEYRVAIVQTVDKKTANLQEIVGPTSQPSLTLITDAGIPDPITGAFPRSTIVRAVRI